MAPDDHAHAFDELPVRPEARSTLPKLLETGLVLGILSNGSAGMLARAVGRAGLEGMFEHVLSADDARRYKPHPSVYALAVDATGYPSSAIGFVTANDWDAAGASAFGLRVAWLRREGQVEPAAGRGPGACGRHLGSAAGPLPALKPPGRRQSVGYHSRAMTSRYEPRR